MLNEFKKKIMKKEYISPEMLTVAFDTASLMQIAITSDPDESVGAGSSLAPSYDGDEDDEEWEDEAPRRRRKRF